jgi:hypothetical protein
MADTEKAEAVYTHDRLEVEDRNVNSADTRLSNAIGELNDAVAKLREKLSNILLPSERDDTVPLQSVPSSPSASMVRVWIDNRTEAVNAVRNEVEDLIRRVDL